MAGAIVLERTWLHNGRAAKMGRPDSAGYAACQDKTYRSFNDSLVYHSVYYCNLLIIAICLLLRSVYCCDLLTIAIYLLFHSIYYFNLCAAIQSIIAAGLPLHITGRPSKSRVHWLFSMGIHAQWPR